MRHAWVVLVVVLWGPAIGRAEIGFETGTLQGTVKTTGELVVPSSHVQVRSTANNSSATGFVDPTTGAYSLDLPVGSYELSTYYESVQVERVPITLTAAGTTHHVRFAAGSIVAHVTRDGADDAAATLQIMEAPVGLSCTTSGATCDIIDPSGFCRCELGGRAYWCDPNMGCRLEMPGSFMVQTDAAGDANKLVPVSTYAVAAYSSSPGGMGMPGMGGQSGAIRIGTTHPVAVIANEPAEGGDYSYDTATVTGTVTAGGAPLPNVTVQASSPEGTVTAWVDPTGTYTLVLPTLATYTITALQDGNTAIDSEPNVTLTPNTTTTLHLSTPGAILSGSVTRDEQPAGGAMIWIARRPPSSCAEASSCEFNDPMSGFCRCEVGGNRFTCMGEPMNSCFWDMPALVSTGTDASGTFQKFLAPGDYDVVAWSASVGGGPMPMMMQFGQVIIGTAQATIDATPVSLSPFTYTTGEVSGTISSCGNPLPNAILEARSTSSPSSMIGSWTDQTGAYTMRIPSGAYTLTASDHGLMFASIPIFVSSTTPVEFSDSLDLGQLRGLILRDGAPSTFSRVDIQEVPVGLSCATADSCDFVDPMGQFCHCEEAGRQFWCDPNMGCRYDMTHQYTATTGSDGFFTASVAPGHYAVLAYSGGGGGTPDPMMPPGGQGGGILVGTVAATVVACQLTEVGASATPVPAGSNVNVDLGDGLELTFAAVSSGTASFIATSTPPPDDPPQFQSAGLFYDIFVPAFTGTVDLCVPYDFETVAAGADLRLYHNDAVLGWVDITTSINTDTHVVCGRTSSFSYFVVGIRPTTTAHVEIAAPETVTADAACQGYATLTATGASAGTTYHWFLGDVALGEGSTITAALPLGTSSVRVTAGSASASASIQVIDTTAPTLSVAVTPSVLWPPNGKMVAVASTPTVHDNCDATPSVTVVGATSPTATPSDVIVAPPAGVQLRAHRAGTETAGRTYSIHYVTNDASGNRAFATATATVPHDRR